MTPCYYLVAQVRDTTDDDNTIYIITASSAEMEPKCSTSRTSRASVLGKRDDHYRGEMGDYSVVKSTCHCSLFIMSCNSSSFIRESGVASSSGAQLRQYRTEHLSYKQIS